MIIDPLKLCKDFQNHVQKNLAAKLVASSETSIESWFRVELIMTLLQSGFSKSSLSLNYSYPLQKNRKADFAFTANDDLPIVFELKSFVYQADSNKKKEFPLQAKRLENHVAHNLFIQGVVFVTFFEYSPKQIQTMIGNFFTDQWNVTNPQVLVAGEKLEFLIAVTPNNKTVDQHS